MSANPRELERKPPPPKPVQSGTIPHGSKDQEIENLKRLLASVSQRLDALKSRA
jgi:hypothetical protein